MTLSENTKYAKQFYDRQYALNKYGARTPDAHPLRRWLGSRITCYNLENAHCLDVGCGRGDLQDIVDDYTGVDISTTVAKCHRKRFVSADSTSLPFPDNEFDLTWTYAVLEHVRNPQAMLEEMRRVTKPGGLIFLHAAWHCPSYAADGLSVRGFRDIPMRWRPRKILAWIDRRAPVRAFRIVSLRFFLLLRHCFGGKNLELHFNKIKPNYETHWMSDSDACCSLDQMEAWFWFQRQGDACLEPNSLGKAYFQTNAELVIRVKKERLVAENGQNNMD